MFQYGLTKEACELAGGYDDCFQVFILFALQAASTLQWTAWRHYRRRLQSQSPDELECATFWTRMRPMGLHI